MFQTPMSVPALGLGLCIHTPSAFAWAEALGLHWPSLPHTTTSINPTKRAQEKGIYKNCPLPMKSSVPRLRVYRSRLGNLFKVQMPSPPVPRDGDSAEGPGTRYSRTPCTKWTLALTMCVYIVYVYSGDTPQKAAGPLLVDVDSKILSLAKSGICKIFWQRVTVRIMKQSEFFHQSQSQVY